MVSLLMLLLAHITTIGMITIDISDSSTQKRQAMQQRLRVGCRRINRPISINLSTADQQLRNHSREPVRAARLSQEVVAVDYV